MDTARIAAKIAAPTTARCLMRAIELLRKVCLPFAPIFEDISLPLQAFLFTLVEAVFREDGRFEFKSTER
jgi:hypothetical protein